MASKATRALKSAVKLRRFRVIPVSPGNPILHLSHLSSFWGAPQRTLQLDSRAQTAFFTNDARLFPDLAPGFQGILAVKSPVPIVPVTLKFSVNTRGDPILTTFPLADDDRPLLEGPRILPQIGFGLGFSTRLILINSASHQASTGNLIFRTKVGDPFDVPLGDIPASTLHFDLSPASGIEGPALRPVLPAALIQLPSSEIVVSVGSASPIGVRVLDTGGQPIDNAQFTLTSLDPEIATIDGGGMAIGVKRGFSTLTIEAENLLATATITVVDLNTGAPGFDVGGLAQDTAGRVFLASRNRHSIFLSEGLGEEPTPYAGVMNQAGLLNDERLSSLFQNPASLAINQLNGALYVADRDNHSVRVVQAGEAGRVGTVAGNGLPGSTDGSSGEARFRDPRSVALDDSGQLWVADTGNHTIRRIDLLTGVVNTVAGQPGLVGASDGFGAGARFNSPVAVAIERESLAAQLERERLNQAKPPIAVLVADRGNNRIRRVREDRTVETVKSSAPGPAGAGTDAIFENPSSVIVDPFGLVFVAQENGELQAILPSGDVVDAVEPGTFANPGQMAIVQGGRLLVADGERAGREVVYGAPSVALVEPPEVAPEGGEEVAITGQNFGPESIVVVGGVLVGDVEVVDSQTIRFSSPPLRSGVTTLSVQNRGGTAQRSLFVRGIPLSSLPPGHITTIAGGSTYIGDGLLATETFLENPYDVALSSSGDLFVADLNHIRVRRVDAETGVITTVAGTGDLLQSAPDGGPATATPLDFPRAILVDSRGDLLIADLSGIRRVSSATGDATIVARSPGFSPFALAFDPAGNIVASTQEELFRVIVETGEITLLAGGNGRGFSGDGGPALSAQFSQPEALAVDSQGNVFVADSFNNRIRRIDATTQTIETVTGNGDFVCCGSGFQDGPATQTGMGNPSGLAFDEDGNLLIADTQGHAIRKLSTATGMISTVPLAFGSLLGPRGLLVDGSGAIILADTFQQQVKRINPRTSQIRVLVGSGETGLEADGSLGIGAALEFDFEKGIIAANGAGDVFIADFRADRVRAVDGETGIITTIAGGASCPPDCSPGFGDGGPATEALIQVPRGLALDDSHLYIGENWCVRRVDLSTGVITTVAGTGNFGSEGDGGPAVEANLDGFLGLALDSEQNLYIGGDQTVRRVDGQTGVIDRIAGTGVAGFSGDGGDALLAQFFRPIDLAIDLSGNLFVADTINHRIRRVDAETGVITTVAGSGPEGFGGGGFSGDGGPATEARLQIPEGVAVAGDILFVADRGNGRVRRVDLTTGIITTVAGGICCGADGSHALQILFQPQGLALDDEGNLYIGDIFNESVRAVRGPIP